MSNILQTPIEFLKGVSSARSLLLQKELGIFKYEDLLNFYPNRYIDRTKYYKINEIQNNNIAEIQIIGKILTIRTIEAAKGSKRLVATFADSTGQIDLVWFQGLKWIKESLQLNVPIVVFGKCSSFSGIYNMAHPEIELLKDHEQSLRTALQPVYPSTELLVNRGVTNRVVTKIMQQLFLETGLLFTETLPEYLITELKLLSKSHALFNIHFPQSQETLTKATFRLKFEELFYIQIQLVLKNLIRKHKIKGHPFTTVGSYFNQFYSQCLPFELTNAQKKLLKKSEMIWAAMLK